jgi:cellulose synthase (UDP-forming)
MRLTNSVDVADRPAIASAVPLLHPRSPWQIQPLVAGLFCFSVLMLLGSYYVSCWTSTGPTVFSIATAVATSQHLFTQERHLVSWLAVPMAGWAMWWPLWLATLFVVGLRWVPCNNWTRPVVKLVALGSAARYIGWRSFGETLNFTNGVSTTLSLWMYGAEMISFGMTVLCTLYTLQSNEQQRSAQADRDEPQVRSGEYQPSVDIFVPTYNESVAIIQRTVIGCQQIEYANKRIYICDDGRRATMRQLAQKLGCGYITQPDGVVNRHAKAGNLNHALTQTDGELIVVFDADFVPYANFLMRTVGFFQNDRVAVLQTPQDTYNADHHTRNLGIDHLFPNDLQHFFRLDQSLRDRLNAAICCGTSYVARRQALASVGGYYTGCIPEDASTSFLLLTEGWEVAYLNEPLSNGEAPRHYRDFITQRMRWLQGNLQIFLRYRDIPVFTSPQLSGLQKISMLAIVVGTIFGPLTRMTYFLVPLISSYLGSTAYVVTAPEVIYYTLPYMALMVGSYAWVSNYHHSQVFSDMYETIVCIPSIQTMVSMLWQGAFKGGFKVTAKGVTSAKKSYNLGQTWLLWVLAALYAGFIGVTLWGREARLWSADEGQDVLLLWMGYNLFWLVVGGLAAIDQPERRQSDRYPMQTNCAVMIDGVAWKGHTLDVSEGGVRLQLGGRVSIKLPRQVDLIFEDRQFAIAAAVLDTQIQPDQTQMLLRFAPPTIAQSRHLTSMLYSEYSGWKRAKQIGTIDAWLAVLKAVLTLRPIRRSSDRQRCWLNQKRNYFTVARKLNLP